MIGSTSLGSAAPAAITETPTPSPPLPAFQAAKNALTLTGRGYKMCVEFLYDNSDPDPANWLYYRKARYDVDLTVTIDQLGNPSVSAPTLFVGGKPIGDVDDQRDMSSASSQMQIILPNAARAVNAICEFYDLTMMPGRLLWVHPDFLSDGAIVESVFQIQSVAPVRDHAAMTVTPYSFNPLTKMIPAEVITAEKWPGVAGIRARFLV